MKKILLFVIISIPLYHASAQSITEYNWYLSPIEIKWDKVYIDYNWETDLKKDIGRYTTTMILLDSYIVFNENKTVYVVTPINSFTGYWYTIKGNYKAVFKIPYYEEEMELTLSPVSVDRLKVSNSFGLYKKFKKYIRNSVEVELVKVEE